MGEDVVKNRSCIFRSIRKYLRKLQTASLRDLHRHHGKTNPCIAAAKASTHFFTDGSYTSFKDWHFIHKARLRLSKLNAVPGYSRRGHVDKRYGKCGRDEIIPHVLNHCYGPQYAHEEKT